MEAVKLSKIPTSRDLESVKNSTLANSCTFCEMSVHDSFRLQASDFK
jgi:hypothetical protein